METRASVQRSECTARVQSTGQSVATRHDREADARLAIWSMGAAQRLWASLAPAPASARERSSRQTHGKAWGEKEGRVAGGGGRAGPTEHLHTSAPQCITRQSDRELTFKTCGRTCRCRQRDQQSELPPSFDGSTAEPVFAESVRVSASLATAVSSRCRTG